MKSPPELWAELSEVERLANHLGEFGQIRITRVEPEKTVAWEGEHGSGTVEIEASGWGTKVTLTAAVAESEAAEPVVEPKPPPEVPAEPQPAQRTAPEPPSAREVPPAAHQAPPERPHDAPPRPLERPPAPPLLPRSLPTEVERRGLLSRLFGRRAPAPEPVRQPPRAEPAVRPRHPEPRPPARPEPVMAREAPMPPPEAFGAPAAAAAQPPAEVPVPVPRPALDPERALAVLEGALDNLGSAHHRPFSRG